MHVSPPSRIVIACREEKEAALVRFMSESVEGTQDCSATWTLLARNLDSPVARALARAAAEPQFSHIAIRVIVLDGELSNTGPTGPSLADTSAADVHILKDARFSAAHEQLVISPTRLWIGDCMRREPVKRDAFELFHADNAAATRHAEVSFERLWLKSKPAKPAMSALVPTLVAASHASINPAHRQASRG